MTDPLIEVIMEFRELLTTLQVYKKLYYKTVAVTLYVPANSSITETKEVEALRPGEVYLLMETGFSSTVTCVQFNVIVDGNVYAIEPCYQPQLYSWGLNFFRDGIIVIAKNYIWFQIINPTSYDAYATIREGFVPIPKELAEKLESKFYSVIRQAISV